MKKNLLIDGKDQNDKSAHRSLGVAGSVFKSPHLRPDKTIFDKVLFDCNALAAASGTEVVVASGRRGIRLTDGLKITLDVSSRNLAEGDQIVFGAHVPEKQGLDLGVNLETSTQTEGIQDPDYFFVWGVRKGAGQRLPEYGWGELLCPIENFHVYGIPAGWKNLTNMILNCAVTGDQVLLSEIRLQKRAKPAGPRLTDVGLLEHLDLQRRDLTSVRKAYARGATAQALAALLRHFRSRTTPRHIYGPKPRNGNFDTAAADRICAHFINGQQLPKIIDWRANPIGYLEWMHGFNRHYFMNTLIEAYQATGNEQYAAELDALMRSWLAANPVPLAHNGGGDPAWETLSTAVRIYSTWLRLFFGLQQSPSFRPETRLMMLKSFLEHAEHLRERSVTKFRNNWLIVESEAIALIGMLFPEFRRAVEWRAVGWRRLAEEMRVQVFPDGAQFELSPGYHMMSISGFRDPYRVARLNRLAIPRGFEKRLIKAHEYIMLLARPDLAVPSANDSGGCSISGGGGIGWLAEGGRLFRRSDMLWVGTGRAEGRPPAVRSSVFNHAGYYVMRSGWTPDARYLFFDAGSLGQSHCHEDKLNFELYAYGQPLILDPGITGYMAEKWTDYYRLTRAHNTLLLDGRGQARLKNEDPKARGRSVAGQNTWCKTGTVEMAAAEYAAGYEQVPGRFVHRRSIIFVDGLYWIIFDEMSGDGEHRIDSLFHFRPGRVLVDAGHHCMRTSRPSHANLDLLLWPQCAEAGMKIVCGEQDPVQGWISTGGEDIPAPVGIFTMSGRLPLRLALLMVPYNTGAESRYRRQALPAPDGVWACEITRPDGCVDLIGYRWHKTVENAAYSVQGTKTKADLLVIQRPPKKAERIIELQIG